MKTEDKRGIKSRTLIQSLLIACLGWLTWKTHYICYKFDGVHYEYHTTATGRWYSPFWWIIAIPVYINQIIKEGIDEANFTIRNEYDLNYDIKKVKGSFAGDLPMWKKKAILFIKIQLDM